jgi:glycosyltransferase involved in cell wall biosynthesis
MSGQRPFPSGDPVAPDVGIIGLVPNRWTDLWQPRHQVMRRLAAFYNVIWMNPAAEWRRALRSDREAPAPVGAGELESAGAGAGASGWQVYHPPPYLPLVHRPAGIGKALLMARLRQAWRRLRVRGARRLVLYLWRPLFRDALALRHDLSVFHIDDDYSFGEEDGERDAIETALIRGVDQVIIHSSGLMERKGSLNPHTANIPNGVDYRAFAEPRPEPADLAAIPRPRIGYAGWLKRQLDWPLLGALAAGSPELSLVLVGATKHVAELEELPAYRALRELPNVHFLGRKTPDQLAGYPQHFDVCVMPYEVNPYTDCIYPLKLHEYLASGRPAVGAPIRALLDFRPLIGLARSVEEWRAAIAAALSPAASLPQARSARQEVARRHDWWVLTAQIARLLAERLGHPAASRMVPVAAGFDPK